MLRTGSLIFLGYGPAYARPYALPRSFVAGVSRPHRRGLALPAPYRRVHACGREPSPRAEGAGDFALTGNVQIDDLHHAQWAYLYSGISGEPLDSFYLLGAERPAPKPLGRPYDGSAFSRGRSLPPPAPLG